MPFTPPQFNNLGKKAKDLFKKGYEYKNEVKVTSKASGVKLESGGYQGKGLAGYSKASFNYDGVGAIDIEAHSCSKAKIQVKNTKLIDGIALTVSSNANPADCVVEGSYSADFVSATGKVTHNLSKSDTKINASAVIGFDNVSVGASVDLNAANISSPDNFNVGAEYSQKDLTASLVTSNSGSDVTVSFFQKVSGDLSLGGSLLIKPDSGNRLFTFGGQYALDKATTLKSKGDSNGIVAASISHKLANPNLAFTVGAQFDALSGDILAAQKMGVSLTFGN